MKVTGAQALFKALEGEGVDTIFGIPGGAILPAYDPLLDSSIRHVLCRHEQGAGHAAEGYAHATGRVGVCMATSGPGRLQPRHGAGRREDGLDPDRRDHRPGADARGRQRRLPGGRHDRRHDAGHQAQHARHEPRRRRRGGPRGVPHRAHRQAGSGADRPAEGRAGERDHVEVARPGRPARLQAHREGQRAPDPRGREGHDARQAPGHLRGRRRAEGRRHEGALRARHEGEHAGRHDADGARRLPRLARDELRHAGDARQLRRGHGDAALGSVDLAGSEVRRPGDRQGLGVRARREDHPPGHRPGGDRQGPRRGRADRRGREGRDRQDGRRAHEASGRRREGRRHLGVARGRSRAGARSTPITTTSPPDGPIKPQYAIERLYEAAGSDTIVVSGVGQHQMWASQFWHFERPRTWINSGGLGTMGFAVPAALGAKAGMPDRRVLAIDGDGCFQMTAQELATSTTENIPFVTAIINNAYLGMVRQWQELFYNERYSAVYLSHDTPDYVKLAEAYGAVGLRAEHPQEVDAVIEKAFSITDRSVVIDFRCDEKEMCFPMVPAGASNDEIITGPEGLRPVEDPAEAPIA